MYATVTQPLTFEEFLAWDDASGREFELLDGIPVPLSEPNANIYIGCRLGDRTFLAADFKVFDSIYPS